MMKKKILSLAIAAIALISFNGMAQTSNSEIPNTTKKECVGKKKCDNVAGKQCKDGKRTKANPYEGMNLTEAQKTQLQQLDGKRKSARKLDMQSKKENKQRNDSLRMAQRRADRKSYLEEVKAIVGPENYVLFLENTYVNGRDRNNKGATFGQGRGDKSKSAHKMHKGKDRNRHASSMRANGSTNATNTNS